MDIAKYVPRTLLGALRVEVWQTNVAFNFQHLFLKEFKNRAGTALKQ